MAIGIRTGDPCGFNKGRSSKFREGSRVRQTPKEGRRTYRPKRCGNNNKDEDNSPTNLNDKDWIISEIMKILQLRTPENNENEGSRLNHHHHHVVPLAWITLILSRHFSLSIIASGRYSHIASECMFVVVVLLLPCHIWRSIGIRHLWARSFFSSSVWFV